MVASKYYIIRVYVVNLFYLFLIKPKKGENLLCDGVVW